MAKKKKNDPTRVTTGKVRFSLPHLLKPKRFEDGEKANFMVTVLVPKSDTETVGKLKKAMLLAKKETFGEKTPRKFIQPLMNGKNFAEDHDLDVSKYKDYIVFRAKSSSEWPPMVVGPNPKQKITDESMIYSGCNGRIVVKASGYDNASKGVGFYMSLVQILPGGERLIAGMDPEDFFDTEEDFDLEDEIDDDDAELDLDEDGDEDLDFG